MTSILLASVPVHGHVTPLLALARAFVERGDRVRFLTGARFADAVTATGAEHVPLPAEADFDDRELSARLPQRRDRRSPVKAIARDIEHVFVRPGAAQYAAVRRLLDACPADAIVTDPTFAGGALMVELPAAARPPVVVAGMLPLNLRSPGLAPFGLGLAPLGGLAGLVRNGVLHALTDRLFASVDAAGREIGRQVHGREPRVPVMEWMLHADAVVQLTVPSFEYDRPDAPGHLVFVGPISESSAATHARPEWWDELDGTGPVIHVTQGTLANSDVSELIRPTIDAFAGRDALVVVATGGAPLDRLGELPANVRAAAFLPYEELLARTDVMVTNGGYGGVQFALGHGVPLVVAPGKEDKVEVAARVAWSGAGLNLRSQRPSSARLRRAVEHVLAEPRFARCAGRIATDIAASPGAAGFVRVVDDVIARRPTAAVVA